MTVALSGEETVMVRLVGVVLVISSSLFLGPAQATSALAQTVPVTTNIRFPVEVEAFVPCANDGAGETVLLSATVHSLVHQSTDEAGGTHFLVHDNLQGAGGRGVVTGDRYRGVSSSSTTSHNFDPFVGAPYGITFVQNTRFIGAGPGNNFTLLTRLHVTVNANDEVVRDFFEFTVKCA
jgi:hypothetical protein